MQGNCRRGRCFSFVQIGMLILLALSLGACCRDDNDCEEGFVCVRKERGIGKECRRAEGIAGDNGEVASQVAPPPPDEEDSPVVEGPPDNAEFLREGILPSETLYDRKLGLLRLTVRGGRNAQERYLFGPLNRTYYDMGCELEEGRYLIVNEDGNDFREPDPNQPYLTGQPCNSQPRNPEDINCHGYEPREGDPPYCRIDLEAGDRIEIYTKLMHGNGTYRLVTRDQNNNIHVDSIEFQAVPRITNINAFISGSEPKVIVEADYENTASIDIHDCDWEHIEQPGLHLESHQGHIRYECPMSYLFRWNNSKMIDLYLFGVGGVGNLTQRSLEVSIDDIEATLTANRYTCDPNSNVAYPDCPGEAFLVPNVQRQYQINDTTEDRVLISGHTIWTKEYSFRARDNVTRRFEEVEHRNIQGFQNAMNLFRTPRNHNHSEWRLTITDFNHSIRFVPEVHNDYVPIFENNYGVHGACQGETTTFDVRWNLAHLREVRVEERCNWLRIDQQPDINDYRVQNGHAGASLIGHACYDKEDRNRRITCQMFWKDAQSREARGEVSFSCCRVGSPCLWCD